MKDAVLSGLYLDSNIRKYFNEVVYKLATMLSQKLEENVMYTLVHGFFENSSQWDAFFFSILVGNILKKKDYVNIA